MLGILGSKINGVRAPTAVGSLDDNTLHMAKTDILRVSLAVRNFAQRATPNETYLWLDVERGELLLASSLTVVAWVNTNFNLSVQTRVNFRRRIDAPHWRSNFGVPIARLSSTSRIGRRNILHSQHSGAGRISLRTSRCSAAIAYRSERAGQAKPFIGWRSSITSAHVPIEKVGVSRRLL